MKRVKVAHWVVMGCRAEEWKDDQPEAAIAVWGVFNNEDDAKDLCARLHYNESDALQFWIDYVENYDWFNVEEGV